MPSSDDQLEELITVESKRNTTLFTILLCIRPRKEETRAPKKKRKKREEKEREAYSFVRSYVVSYATSVIRRTSLPGPW